MSTDQRPDPPAVPDRPADTADGLDGGTVSVLAEWAAAPGSSCGRSPEAAWSGDLPTGADDGDGPPPPPTLVELAAQVAALSLKVGQLQSVVNRLSRRQDRVDAVWPDPAGDVFDQWFAGLCRRYHFTGPEAATILDDSALRVEFHGLHLWWQEAFGRNPDGHEQALWHEHLIDVLERINLWPHRTDSVKRLGGYPTEEPEEPDGPESV